MCFRSDGIAPSSIVLFMSSDSGPAKPSAQSFTSWIKISDKPDVFLEFTSFSYLQTKYRCISTSSIQGSVFDQNHFVHFRACRSAMVTNLCLKKLHASSAVGVCQQFPRSTRGGGGGCSPEMIIRYVPRFGDLDFRPVLSIIIQLVS